MDTDGVPPAATPTATPTTSGLGLKRTASDGTGDSKKARTQTTVADPQWSLEKQHADAIINFLIRYGTVAHSAKFKWFLLVDTYTCKYIQ